MSKKLINWQWKPDRVPLDEWRYMEILILFLEINNKLGLMHSFLSTGVQYVCYLLLIILEF